MGHGGSPFFPDPSHSLYRNMLVPPFNTPYHLQISRFPSPEDLSRNTKALDLLQQHASQYYSTHKIHELGDQVNHLRNPSGGPKMPTTPDIPSPQQQQQQQQMNANNIGSSSSNNNNNNGNSSAGNDKSSLKSSDKSLSDDKDEGSLRKLNESDKDDGKDDKQQQLKDDHLADDEHHTNDVHSEEKNSKTSNDHKDDDDGSSSSNEKTEKLCNSSNDKDSNSSFPSNHIIPNSTQLEGMGKLAGDRHDIDRISSSPPSQR
jgi:hypothetical protein